MPSRLSTKALVGALMLTVTLALSSWGQDKKDPPKKPEPKAKPARVAIADPKEVDADFAVQGEYIGELEKKKLGAQIVALGNGSFDLRLLTGGLPGEGWDNKTQQKLTGKRDGEVVKFSGSGMEGAFAGGQLKIKTPSEITFTKVERKSPTLGAKPPEGAVVLFGGPEDVSKWNGGKLRKLSDGEFLAEGVKSKEAFGACRFHMEFRLAYMPNSRGQGRSNSGLYLQDRYEVQILDSFGLKGENNECGGIYQQYAPLTNMCYPPLAWQTYDIDFTPAQFDAEGKKIKPARATIRHNGVVIHDNIEFKGATPGGQVEKPTPGPFQLQNHGDPLVFRNIWVLPLKDAP